MAYDLLKQERKAMTIKPGSLMEIVYLAGHFDGEGCICMRRRKQDKAIPRLHVEIRCSYRPTLEKYENRFGGHLRATPHASTNKLLYSWALLAFSEMYPFLKQIEPFLEEKLPQAQVALKYLEARLNCKANRASLPNDIYVLADETYRILKELKHKPPYGLD